MARRRTSSAFGGRFSAHVLHRRIKSLGYQAQGEWSKPADVYRIRARRLSDGLEGELRLWWTSQGGWGSEFVCTPPASR